MSEPGAVVTPLDVGRDASATSLELRATVAAGVVAVTAEIEPGGGRWPLRRSSDEPSRWIATVEVDEWSPPTRYRLLWRSDWTSGATDWLDL